MRGTVLICIFVSIGLLLPVSNLHAEELNWVGCGIVKKAFMAELAAAYEKKTGVKIVIKGGGATKGIRDVAAGNADIGGTCRHSIDVPEEKGITLHHVAWDALVVITHKDNPVDSLSTQCLKKILTGEVKNCKDFDGPDQAITLFVRTGKISGVGLMTRELVLRNPDFEFTTHAIEKPSSGPLEIAVGETPTGFGITGVSSAKKRSDLKILKINGIPPSKASLMSGRYAYVRPLYLVTQSQPSEAVKKFIDYALSKEGQAVISAQGTVNLAEGGNCKEKFVANYKGKYYEKTLNW